MRAYIWSPMKEIGVLIEAPESPWLQGDVTSPTQRRALPAPRWTWSGRSASRVTKSAILVTVAHAY